MIVCDAFAQVLGPPRAGLIGNPVSVDKFDVRAQRQLIEESKKNARRGIEEREAQERRAREERAAQELAAEEELHALFNRHGFFHTANNAGCSDDESYDPTEFVFEVTSELRVGHGISLPQIEMLIPATNCAPLLLSMQPRPRSTPCCFTCNLSSKKTCDNRADSELEGAPNSETVLPRPLQPCDRQ